ncbi:MAG: FecR domain-containing protein [Steroidobacteraceae bacterium]
MAEEYANGRSGAWYWQQALGTVALDFVRSLRTHPLSFIAAVITGAKRRDRMREDAFAWLARLRRGLRPEEGSELREWLKRRSHRACIARTAAERDGPEALAVLGEIFLVNPEWIDSSPRRNPAINVAAALTATFIAALPLLYTHHYMPGFLLGPALEGSYTETMGTAFASGRHTLRRVILADGTRVVMNRGTRMVVLGRSVLLTRGEATFTVTPGALPFELTADGHPIRTLAATFNTRLTGRDAMEVTVLEGTVTVFPSHVSTSVNPARLSEGDVRLPVPTPLHARQTLDIDPGTESVRTLSQLEAQARIAWQRG